MNTFVRKTIFIKLVVHGDNHGCDLLKDIDSQNTERAKRKLAKVPQKVKPQGNIKSKPIHRRRMGR